MVDQNPKHTDTTHNLLYLKGGGPRGVRQKTEKKTEKPRKTAKNSVTPAFYPKKP